MKTYVLDTSALLAFIDGKPGAVKVRDCLNEALRGRAAVFMSAINYGEVYGVLLRLYGRDRALSTMSAVHPLPINIADATRQRALDTAETKLKYKLYYADGFAAALAIELTASLVTSDSDFRRLSHSFPIVWLKV